MGKIRTGERENGHAAIHEYSSRRCGRLAPVAFFYGRTGDHFSLEIGGKHGETLHCLCRDR